MILGNLCDSLVEQTYRADLPRGAGKASDRPGRTGPDFWARRNWLICAQPSGRPVSEYGPDLAGYACERVAELVSSSMSLGVPRREYSLASKVLHWLMPWRVPVYDSFVRDALGVPKGWDHPQAYRKIAAEVFPMARTMTGNPGWIGSLEPRSPLRALDKLAWWLGGGSTGAAAEVHDPWKVPRLLGLDCP
jgi:hypothetical protein